MSRQQNIMLKSTHDIMQEILSQLQSELTGMSEKINQSYETGGQWHDNPHWDGMLRDQQQLIKKLSKIKAGLSPLPIFIDDLNISGKTVTIGTEVAIKYHASGTKETFFLVSSQDIQYNPVCQNSEAYISINSPVAKALIGKKIGDEVKIDAPAGIQYAIILDIKKLI